MRVLLTTILYLAAATAQAQSNGLQVKLPIDSCAAIQKEIAQNCINGTKHSNPILLINDVIPNGIMKQTNAIRYNAD